jgi:hypothetical protein
VSAFEVVGEESRERGARARARRARPSAGGLFFERGKERFEDARRAAPAVNDGCFRVNKKRHVFLVRAPRSARLARSRRRRISGAPPFVARPFSRSFFCARFFACVRLTRIRKKYLRERSFRNDSHTWREKMKNTDFRGLSFSPSAGILRGTGQAASDSGKPLSDAHRKF